MNIFIQYIISQSALRQHSKILASAHQLMIPYCQRGISGKKKTISQSHSETSSWRLWKHCILTSAKHHAGGSECRASSAFLMSTCNCSQLAVTTASWASLTAKHHAGSSSEWRQCSCSVTAFLISALAAAAAAPWASHMYRCNYRYKYRRTLKLRSKPKLLFSSVLAARCHYCILSFTHSFTNFWPQFFFLPNRH